MTFKQTFVFSLVIVLSSCASQGDKEEDEQLAEKALASFDLYEGLQIELIASEPLVADPVAMEVDELGRTYVLEMHGYPLDLSGSGVIKQLLDTDTDGQFDEAVVFADGLKLPTGLMRWKNGLVVVDVPDVLYLEDTNGDGKADRKEVLLTGFAVTNPQHIANTPMYGLDNWIYVAHQGMVTPKVSVKEFSDEGSEVHYPANDKAPKLPIDANGRNVRFIPDFFQLEMLSGESQYGQTFDAWGHHFGTSNADHLFTEVIPARYLARNPNLVVADAMENIPDHGSAAEVFPITQNPANQLLTDVGVITSSCGVTWYQAGLIKGFENVTFVAEPVHNLVHADRVIAKGASFRASRLVENKEFLASTDAWFRPVQFYVGPDGALYMIDYYRQIVEHPEWMSEEVNNSGALYNGSNQGRIYRISPKGTAPMNWAGSIDIPAMTSDEIVTLLGSDNIWWRRNVQRLIVANEALVPNDVLIDYVASTERAVGFLHGLWALEGRGQLTAELIERGLRHKAAGVRENAIRLAEIHLTAWPTLAKTLVGMSGDSDARVRFQLLCTLGFVDTKEATEARNQLLRQDINDRWVQVAALSASYGKESELLSETISTLANSPSEGTAMFFSNCAAAMATSGNQKAISEMLKKVLSGTQDQSDAWWKSAVLRGIDGAVKNSGLRAGNAVAEMRLLKAQLNEKTPAEVRAASVRLLTHLPGIEASHLADVQEKALQLALNGGASPALRTDALLLLTKSANGAYIDKLSTLVSAQEPDDVQEGAINAIVAINNQAASQLIVKSWSSLTPDIRDHAMGHLLNSESGSHALLDAVDAGSIDQATIAWPRKVRLMNSYTDGIRKKARRLLATNNEAPGELVKKYQQALDVKGDRVAGAAVFKANCAVCHQEGGEGGSSFGPDLGTIRNRDASFILADIINPNRSIADGFETWELKTSKGEQLTGVIASETASSLSIKDPAGNLTTVNRNEIESLKASDVSAMPTGFENSISVEQMSDLIAYLKR
ncbi:c-type cytochrome [Imperialibacter roseus]|uniref:C-type cytochrome n=1 Tax=Imperialibacter roseus TaxID=1324217 RepID=A0ABZ0IVP0_9BACT|nr:PVC-type heme-binding CxxCH protein [Imperialibacter roseus]WOK09049.1 c-type cytochrome [Imperialibacter roseus]